MSPEIGSQTSTDPAILRPATVLGWAIVFGLMVDLWIEGPPGLGILLAAAMAALGLIMTARPRAQSLAFLAAGVLLVSFVVIRDSPVLVGLDVLTASGLFALAGGFAREGDPFRAGMRAYAARAVALTASIPAAAAVMLRPFAGLLRGRRRTLVFARALLIALPAGLAFAPLLGSADAVFAELLGAPFEQVRLGDLPRHAIVVAAAGGAFVTLAVRSTVPTRLAWAAKPIEGGGLRPSDWVSLLVTVDVIFALFVGVQLVAFFGGRTHVLETGLTFAEYARSGFWQMLVAATLTGLVIAAAWIGGRPTAGPQRTWFLVLASLLVCLSLVVLASAFQRLVLYETEFGYTWPRLIPHAAILLTAALLVCGLVAVLSGRTAWLSTAALGLGVLTLLGLNLLDPEAFIAERNIARVERGYELDATELASLSADAAPAIAATLPDLDPSLRPQIERDLSCLRAELRRGVDRFGWASFNFARDVALERLDPLSLPGC
ncbi:MAG TPA: DUF4173 domain-containing protein [Actinomycetota bacterium]|nr:DUF4173 domain-containing protein [Actinomycetota bacterium]